ncbi:MAG: lexA [Chloroflexi bacterium]|jgi:repressor LexA|nr:lexA [Chloroflexota bacterium]
MMARRRSKVLSERQKRILEVLAEFQEHTGYPPSIREICDHAKISSTSVVNYYLDQLQELGYIERDTRVSRGIRLIAAPDAAVPITNTFSQGVRQTAQNLSRGMAELLKIPMVGRIQAGLPMPIPPSDFSYYDAESMIDVATSLLPTRERADKDLFALEVQGDSMIDAMINDGDIVIMKPILEARNGEMVAVWLDDRDETTLKYFYLENGHVRLQPANPTMKPIYIDDPANVRIQGKVVMVIRKVGGLPS